MDDGPGTGQGLGRGLSPWPSQHRLRRSIWPSRLSAPQQNVERGEPVGAARWAVAALAVLIGSSDRLYANRLGGLKGLNNDTGAQYWLSKMTAEGAVPLVDFEHGWNAGSWWLTSLLYRLARGDPDVFELLHQTVFGSILVLVLVVTIAVRLRWSPAVIALAAALAVMVANPPTLKYAFPVLWVALLLPNSRLGEGRAGIACCAIAAFVLMWIHVELALLLAAGTGAYDLLAGVHHNTPAVDARRRPRRGPRSRGRVGGRPLRPARAVGVGSQSSGLPGADPGVPEALRVDLLSPDSWHTDNYTPAPASAVRPTCLEAPRRSGAPLRLVCGHPRPHSLSAAPDRATYVRDNAPPAHLGAMFNDLRGWGRTMLVADRAQRCSLRSLALPGRRPW